MIEAIDRLDLFAWAARYGVVVLRIGGMVTFLPIFGADILPIRIRVFLALAVSLIMLPLVGDTIAVPVGAGEWLVAAVREISVGLGFGLVARGIFAGIEAAAALIARQSGFAMANMVDPLSGDQALAPALFQNMVALAMFLAADLHHLIIRAMRESYAVLPASGGLPDLSAMGEGAALIGTRIFVIAAQLAGPALLLTFAMDLLLAMVGRAMTQVPILLVGYPVKLAAGLVAMALLATTTGAALGWLGRTMASDGMALFSALAGQR